MDDCRTERTGSDCWAVASSAELKGALGSLETQGVLTKSQHQNSLIQDDA